MTKDEANHRTILSRRTLWGWRASGGPTGSVEDNLRMIGEEIAILRGIVAEHPERALTVGNLVGHYQDLAERLKAGAN
jgi:hypothetical protein